MKVLVDGMEIFSTEIETFISGKMIDNCFYRSFLDYKEKNKDDFPPQESHRSKWMNTEWAINLITKESTDDNN